MRCADCPEVPNGTRKRPICCRLDPAGRHHPVEDLVKIVRYRPGWVLAFVQGALEIRAEVVNADDHSRTLEIFRRCAPPPSYANIDWERWLFNEIMNVERHEAAEFFEVGGVKVFDPHKEAA